MGSRAPWASPSCFSKLGVATRACVCSRCSTIAAIFSPSTRRQRQRQKQRRRNHPQKNPPKRFNRSLFARGGTSFIFLFVFCSCKKHKGGGSLVQRHLPEGQPRRQGKWWGGFSYPPSRLLWRRALPEWERVNFQA